MRFSKDPTPYKAHYGAAFSRTGRKGPYACYYVHCDPGACFVGGGLWMPDAARLAKLRRSVDERPRAWRRVLGEEAFRRTFLPGVKSADGDEACLRAFAKHNKEHALKTKPKVSGRCAALSPYPHPSTSPAPSRQRWEAYGQSR